MVRHTIIEPERYGFFTGEYVVVQIFPSLDYMMPVRQSETITIYWGMSPLCKYKDPEWRILGIHPREFMKKSALEGYLWFKFEEEEDEEYTVNIIRQVVANAKFCIKGRRMIQPTGERYTPLKILRSKPTDIVVPPPSVKKVHPPPAAPPPHPPKKQPPRPPAVPPPPPPKKAPPQPVAPPPSPPQPPKRAPPPTPAPILATPPPPPPVAQKETPPVQPTVIKEKPKVILPKPVPIAPPVEKPKQETPRPVAPPPPSPIKGNLCKDCGKPLRFIEKYDRWYCDSCKKYAPKEEKAKAPGSVNA